MAKIIIVEDDVNIASIYKKKLEEGGHTATIVPDSDAVKQIRMQKPDLVLLDILMPNVSGLDILREIKMDSETLGVPVLLLTNVAEDTSIAKGMEYGAYAYLLKAETKPEEILPRINMTLSETSKAKGQ